MKKNFDEKNYKNKKRCEKIMLVKTASYIKY